MNKEDDKNDRSEEESGATGSETTNEDAKRDADGFELDKDNRGERPDNLRRRSEWFQKRTGGR